MKLPTYLMCLAAGGAAVLAIIYIMFYSTGSSNGLDPAIYCVLLIILALCLFQNEISKSLPITKHIFYKGGWTAALATLGGIIIFTGIEVVQYVHHSEWDSFDFIMVPTIFIAALVLTIVPAFVCGEVLAIILKLDADKKTESKPGSIIKGALLGIFVVTSICTLVYVALRGNMNIELFLQRAITTNLIGSIGGSFVGYHLYKKVSLKNNP